MHCFYLFVAGRLLAVSFIVGYYYYYYYPRSDMTLGFKGHVHRVSKCIFYLFVWRLEPEANSKTNDSNMFTLGVGNDLS